MTGLPLSPDDVAAICRHMDDDHRAAALLICRRLAGQPDALDVRTVGVDGARLHFEVRRGDGTTCAASVPFPRPVVDRRQVRAAVVELYERARAAEGLSDRT